MNSRCQAFAGVGSEVYGAVRLGRRAVGAELKPSYFSQAVANLADLDAERVPAEQPTLFDDLDADEAA